MTLGVNTKEFYEASYTRSDQREWRRLGAIDKANNIVRLCAGISHDTVLEVGCGTGAILSQLRELRFGRELRGVELSGSAAEMCRAEGLEVDVFSGDELPYGDHQFDLVILSHVLEHLEHPRVLLYEAARVGRHLFVEVPLEDNARLSRDHVFDEVGHINHYNPTTIRRLLQTCGLAIDAELISNPSRAVYAFRSGNKGRVSWLIKRAALWMSPRIACSIWTYHGSYLAHSLKEMVGNHSDD